MARLGRRPAGPFPLDRHHHRHRRRAHRRAGALRPAPPRRARCERGRTPAPLARAAELLRGREIRVATPAGTDLRFRIGERADLPAGWKRGQAAVAKKPLRIDKEIELPAGVLPRGSAGGDGHRHAGHPDPPRRRGHRPHGAARLLQRAGDRRARGVGRGGCTRDAREVPRAGELPRAGIGFNPALVVPPTEPAIPYAGYGAGMVRLSLGDNRELGGRVSGGDVRWLFFLMHRHRRPAVLVAGGRLAL